VIPDPKRKLSQRELLFLIALLCLSVGPHALHLEPWISIFFIGMVTLRLLGLSRPVLLPGRFLLFLLTMAGLANALAHYPLMLGREAGVALLTSMLALKLLEMKRERDIYVVVYLSLFTLITQFLYRQEMLLVVYVFLVVTGLIAMLMHTNMMRPPARPTGVLVRSGGLLLQALPLMLIMFFLFPRFSSPLWDLGIRDNRAVTGISDNISPGSVSRLSRSRAVAFRVDFDQDRIPEPARRYWRGPVLWDTDGRQWTAGDQIPERASDFFASGKPVDYSVILEPTGGKWLFALDLPHQIPTEASLEADFQLIRRGPQKRRFQYRTSSYLDYNTGALSEFQRFRGLQLPDNITPRMISLVEQWRGDSDSALVDQALAYFNEQPFHYTLYPAPLGDNPADQFLFDSRQGFCEHYATSFTLLMRIAGIPARVVAGYQGGEVNPISGHLVVRQSDAHAWSEVWLPELGWVRIDPTSAVAPERIEQPLDLDRISEEIGAPIDFVPVDIGFVGALIEQFNWSMDALDASWHRWVLGYSKKRQSKLMNLLGLGFLKGSQLVYAMVGITAVAITLMTLALIYRSRPKPNPVQAQYQRFSNRLKKSGLQRRSYEGPRDYGQRILHRRPDLRGQVEPILRLYIGIRYGRMNNLANLRRLKQMVGGFRP